MRRLLLILLGFTVWGMGCQPSPPPADPADPGSGAVFPETRTPLPTFTPIVDLTEETSPTPLLPATQIPTAAPQKQATVTPFPRRTPIPLVPGEEVTITKIKMISPHVGWAIGHQEDGFSRVLYSQDGGATWLDRTPPLEIAEISYTSRELTAYFYNEQLAWVIFPDQRSNPAQATHQVWITEDAGKQWRSSLPLPVRGVELDFIPREFTFINPQQGWLRVHLGYMMMHDYTNLYRTEDGGTTWKRIIDPERNQLQGYHNTGLAFASATHGWVTKDNLGGAEPVLEQTRDGGETWKILSLPAPAGLSWIDPPQSCRTESPTFTSIQTGLLLVNCFPYQNGSFDMTSPVTYLYATSDWGENWLVHQFPTPVYQLTFLDYLIGFAIGKHHYQTFNGGADWSEIKTVTWQGEFSFISPQEGWAVAQKGDDLALVHTRDGGKTYQQINPTAAYPSAEKRLSTHNFFSTE